MAGRCDILAKEIVATQLFLSLYICSEDVSLIKTPLLRRSLLLAAFLPFLATDEYASHRCRILVGNPHWHPLLVEDDRGVQGKPTFCRNRVMANTTGTHF